MSKDNLLRRILELADPTKTKTVRGLVELTPTDEADFQDRTRGLFTGFGWDFYHTLNSIGSDPDFPDCVSARPGRVVVAELKVRAKPTPGQMRWLALFQSVGIEAYLWYPADWPQMESVARDADRAYT